MTDTLYRSHSLGYSKNDNNEIITSGSLTLWEDSPVSPFDVGDTFHPVQGGPELTVEKVSINDNVIGEINGRLLRQWEITIEGSNETQSSTQQTHIKYNFNISADEKSGTMEVVNNGDNPAITLDIGDIFSVPGIGQVFCSNVKGNDEYDNYGLHTWTVVYEGTDKEVSEGSLPETKYSLAIQKDYDGVTQKSGSMSVVNEGDAPTLNISVGSTFNVPGLGSVTCSKVSGSDDYTDTGSHRWTMTYEGYVNSPSDGQDETQGDSDSNAKYSFSMEKDSSGSVTHSGSVEIISAGNSPAFAHNVGATLNLPGIGNVTCTKVSGSDSYSDTGTRKWTVIYEGSDKSQSEIALDSNIKYSLSIENNSDGVTVYSGSKEITCTGDSPTVSMNIGDTFSLPLVGLLTCTRIQSSNEDNNTWKVVFEGSRSGATSGSGEEDDISLPDSETTTTYEINGSTVRTVSGEFIALRRSETPITKKTITVYTSTVDAVALPGSTYQGGIVTSENIIKETVKNNGVVTGSYYKHTIEVEA